MTAPPTSNPLPDLGFAGPGVEVIDDPQRIRTLLRALGAREHRAIVRMPSAGATAVCSARLSAGGRLLVAWDDRPPIDGPAVVEISGHYSDYCFELPSAAVGVPERLMRIRRRLFRRAAAPDGVSLALDLPGSREQAIVRQVLDASYYGVSIATVPDRDRLRPGMTLDNITIRWKRGSAIRARATVRHTSARIHGSGWTCGLELDLGDQSVDTPWVRQVESLLCPNTRIGPRALDEVWNAYVASGYFGLSEKAAAEFAPLRGAFASAQAAIGRARHLGCLVSWPAPERVEATLALVKPWQHSWLVYQLARHQEDRPLGLSSNHVLRDIYLHAYEHAGHDPDLRWHVGYVQDDAYFSKRVHLDFPRRHADGEHAVLLPFRAWEGRTDGGAAPAAEAVGEATGADIEALLRHIAARFPAPYADALDLLPGRFSLRATTSAWEAAGLVRRRQVLVSRRGGRAVAAAVLELASDGVHLFGLLDLVRLFALEPEGAAAFPELLAAARRWYAEHGKRKFVYFDELGEPSHAGAAGLRDLGGATLVIFRADLVPDFLDHVIEVTADTAPVRLRAG